MRIKWKVVFLLLFECANERDNSCPIAKIISHNATCQNVNFCVSCQSIWALCPSFSSEPLMDL